MNWLTAVAKTVGSRFFGAAAATLAGWVFVHTKGVVTVDPTTLVEVGGTMLATYAAAHRAGSSVVNPGDAAKGRVVDAVKTAADSGGTVVVPPSQ